jgi:hypothetical protein
VAPSETGVISNNADNAHVIETAETADGAPARNDKAGSGVGGSRADGKFEGAAIGAAIGATAATAASLVALLSIPGVGAVAVAGWLAAILGSMAVGGVTGGLLGALTKAGISVHDAQVLAEGVRRGGTLIPARVPQAEVPRIEAVMDRSAVELQELSDLYRKSGWQSFDPNAVPYSADQIHGERALQAH